MSINSQQSFEDKNYHFRCQLETFQEKQVENKKERRFLEKLQEQFYKLHQKEQQLYQQTISEVDSEERSFFEERLDEGTQLARKADQEFEEEQANLQKEYQQLMRKEDDVRSDHKSFLNNKRKEKINWA